jgi:hypothetical protein
VAGPKSGRSREPHWLALIALSAVIGIAISYVGLNDPRAPWASREPDASLPAPPTSSPPARADASATTTTSQTASPAAAPATRATTPVATPARPKKTVFTIDPTSPHGSTDDSNTTTPQLRFWTVPPPDGQSLGHLHTGTGGLRGTYGWVDELSGNCQPLEVSWFFTGIPSGAYDVELFTPEDDREASSLSLTGNLSTTSLNQVDKKGQWTYLFTVRTREGYRGQTVLDVSARQEAAGTGGRCRATGRRLLFDSVRITRAGGG